MTERDEPTLEVNCVVCGRPMALVRPARAQLADDVKVFECAPCGFSITQSRMPVMKQGKPENRTAGE